MFPQAIREDVARMHEYALRITLNADTSPRYEFIPARDRGHAVNMAHTTYACQTTRVVGRDADGQSWRLAYPLSLKLGESAGNGQVAST